VEPVFGQEAAGRDDNRSAGKIAARCLHHKAGVARPDRLDFCVENRPNTAAGQVSFKCPDHVARVVRHGKDSAPPFKFGFQTLPFKKGQKFRTEKTGKRAVKKAAVGPIHREKCIAIRAVGQIAPGFSADENFFSRTIRFFQHNNRSAALGGAPRGHQTRRARADDHHIRIRE